MYWAMRTDRNQRYFIHEELIEGRLRQGWGYEPQQDLYHIHEAWNTGVPLTQEQQEAVRHFRMYNGPEDEYMNQGEVVLVTNMPDDGLFTLCEITGEYEFNIADGIGDYGHIRPVEILIAGVANQHELVNADLQSSLRCLSRLWRIEEHGECLNNIINHINHPFDHDFGV